MNVNEVYKATYNWGATILYAGGSVGDIVWGIVMEYEWKNVDNIHAYCPFKVKLM